MIEFSRRSSIKLNDLDAAIILKEDGTLEASLPEIETEHVPENVLTGAALIYALSNEVLCEQIRDNFLKQSQETDLKTASNDA